MVGSRVRFYKNHIKEAFIQTIIAYFLGTKQFLK